MLNFEKPDMETFRNLALAYEALKKGGNVPCILNAANEIAVDAFLNDKIGFLQIPDLIEGCLNKVPFIKSPGLEDYFETDRETRILAKETIK
jgi:1-deoxy-D-xylulose-5-phosphate reductoisomerase